MRSTLISICSQFQGEIDFNETGVESQITHEITLSLRLGEADHIHLMLEMHPNIEPAKLINSLKTVSSRLIRKEFAEQMAKFYWKPVLWSRAYCLITAGGAPLSILKEYIEKQGKPK